MDLTVETIGRDRCIHLGAHLTFDNSPIFSQVLEAITADISRAIISLKHLKTMDSTGVGMLKLAQDRAEEMGCALIITDIPEQLQVFVRLLKK